MLSSDTVSFLRDLAANNDRDWVKANQKRYKEDFKVPAEIFADALASEMGEALGTDMTFKVFRLHRDLRFSKDKTPYNTYLRIVVSQPDVAADHPRWMMGLEQDKLVVGIGAFAFEKQNLMRYREWMDGPKGDELAEMLTDLTDNGGRVGKPDLKRVPAPYDADHKHGDLLKYKGVTVWFDHDDHSAAFGPNGPQQVGESLLRFRAIHDWFARLTA